MIVCAGKYSKGVFNVQILDSNTNEVREFSYTSNVKKQTNKCFLTGKYNNGVYHLKYLEDGEVKTLSYAKSIKEKPHKKVEDIQLPAFMIERSRRMREQRELEAARVKGPAHVALYKLKKRISS